MFKDYMQDWSPEQLKSAYMMEKTLTQNNLNRFACSFDFGKPNIVNSREEYHSYTWNGHTYRYYQTTTNYTIPADWYDTVYRQGAACVRYNNKDCIVLEATEEPLDKLKPDLQIDGFAVFKVRMAVWDHYTPNIEDRYVVRCIYGDEAMAFAAITPGRAASTLKKKMLQKMEGLMGL